MLISTQIKRIDTVYPADMNLTKKCLSAVNGDAPDFDRESGLFDPDTAAYAAALAMSAIDKAMLEENLRELGYDKRVFLAYDGDSPDKTGLALGIREDPEASTVAVVLRPTVGREWYSNFDIGCSTEHRGFRSAAEYAGQRLTDYLFVRRPRHHPRFLVTGYSRGGAAANLLAKRLCDRYGLCRSEYLYHGQGRALRKYFQSGAGGGLFHPRTAGRLGLYQIRPHPQPVRQRGYPQPFPHLIG